MSKNYQVFEALPEFEQAVFQDGKRIQTVSGHPGWTNAAHPPKVGEIVDIRMNKIGLALVSGYFVEENFLGLMVKPFDPPEWYVKQNGYNATAYVFGSEIKTGDFHEPVLNGPSQKQLAAIQRYANAHAGAWKDALSAAWASGADEREKDAGLLRQVRNKFGPEWLFSYQNTVSPKPIEENRLVLDGEELAKDMLYGYGFYDEDVAGILEKDISEVTLDEANELVAAAIFAHKQTDGNENWGNIWMHGNYEAHREWLEKYRKSVSPEPESPSPR